MTDSGRYLEASPHALAVSLAYALKTLRKGG
jgi:hypothetical protein